MVNTSSILNFADPCSVALVDLTLHAEAASVIMLIACPFINEERFSLQIHGGLLAIYLKSKFSL